MKNKFTLSIMALVAMGSFAFAQPSFANDDCRMQQKCNMHKNAVMSNADIFNKLNLSNAQKRAMAQNRQANFKKMKFQNRNRIQMSNYLNAHGFDKARFIKDRTQRSQIRAASMANAFSRQYDILTPMQKKEFIKLLKEKEAARFANMDKRGPRGGHCGYKRG